MTKYKVDSRHSSLRPVYRPPEPPRLHTAAAIDKIFRDAERAAQQQSEKDSTMTSTGPLADIHGPRDIANRIKSLAADGVTQLTAADLKTMKPAEIVQARLDGRLLQTLSGINPDSED